MKATVLTILSVSFLFVGAPQAEACSPGTRCAPTGPAVVRGQEAELSPESQEILQVVSNVIVDFEKLMKSTPTISRVTRQPLAPGKNVYRIYARDVRSGIPIRNGFLLIVESRAGRDHTGGPMKKYESSVTFQNIR